MCQFALSCVGVVLCLLSCVCCCGCGCVALCSVDCVVMCCVLLCCLVGCNLALSGVFVVVVSLVGVFGRVALCSRFDVAVLWYVE